tara:strand:+ start:1455 stop:1760 length:306 start_codon:yes stop_codon:yes gene_type:complete
MHGEKRETVNHPDHYNVSADFEVIDVIEAWQLGFNDGNAVKYIARALHKENTVDDYKKAIWYLQREVARVQKEEGAQNEKDRIARGIKPSDYIQYNERVGS